jgi:sialate O-acetylesterase
MTLGQAMMSSLGSVLARAFIAVALVGLVPMGDVARAEGVPRLTVAAPFSDHAVLQHGRRIPVWGTARPGAGVAVEFADARAATQADRTGAWRVMLPAQSSSFEPRSLLVSSGNERLRFDDVLVGEVWFVAGQSNMEWRLVHSTHGRDALEHADVPHVRFWVSRPTCAAEPRTDVEPIWRAEGRLHGWQPSDRWSANRVSAIGFHFAAELRQRLGRPVGVIQATVGASRIEAWTPRTAFEARPFASDRTWLTDAEADHARARADALRALRDWVEVAIAAEPASVGDPPVWPREPPTWHNRPTCFYNGMVHGLTPYALRGMVWYQGEANVAEGSFYGERLSAFIDGMRTAWASPDLPIALVQLAPFAFADPRGLPLVWEAQLQATRRPGVGLVTISDLVTDLGDLHPANKRDVGRRAAEWALHFAYGRTDVLPSGPLYRRHEFLDGRVRVEFDHARGLSTEHGDLPDEFTLAGDDRRFHPARASIDGSSVILESPGVRQPVAIRFGWHRSARPNLVNDARLPAASFRTDKWIDEDSLR